MILIFVMVLFFKNHCNRKITNQKYSFLSYAILEEKERQVFWLGRLRPVQSCSFCLDIPIMFESTNTVESLGKNKYHQTIVYQFSQPMMSGPLIVCLECLFFTIFVIATHNYFKVTFSSFSETAGKRYLLDKLSSVSPGLKKLKCFLFS